MNSRREYWIFMLCFWILVGLLTVVAGYYDRRPGGSRNMSIIEVPGEIKQPEEAQKPTEPEVPSHHPADEDLIEGVSCPHVSTIQIFQPHPKPIQQPRMVNGQVQTAAGLQYFEVAGQALWGQCHKKCAKFDHESQACSDSAKSRERQLLAALKTHNDQDTRNAQEAAQ